MADRPVNHYEHKQESRGRTIPAMVMDFVRLRPWLSVRIVLGFVALALLAVMYMFPYARLFGMRSGLELPAPDIPQYPGAPPLSWAPAEFSGIAAGLGMTTTQARFETADSPKVVLAFYKGAMQEAHWDWDQAKTGTMANPDYTLHFSFYQARHDFAHKFHTLHSVDITAEPAPEGRTRVLLTKTLLDG